MAANQSVPGLALPPLKQPGNVKEDLDAMKHKHREIARMHFLGMSNNDIAKEMGVNHEWVSKILNSDNTKVFLEELEGAAQTDAVDLDGQVEKLTHESIKYMRDVVTGKVTVADSLKIKAAMRGAEMGGRGPIQKVTGNIEHNIARTALEEMKARGMEVWAEKKRLAVEIQEIDVVPTDSD